MAKHNAFLSLREWLEAKGIRHAADGEAVDEGHVKAYEDAKAYAAEVGPIEAHPAPAAEAAPEPPTAPPAPPAES